MSTVVQVAEKFHSKTEAWDLKAYVLGALFYRYISEDLTKFLNSHEHAAGNHGFDYSKVSDTDAELGRSDTIDEKGYYILPSQLFSAVRERADDDENLNETLEAVFTAISGSAKGTASEHAFVGLFGNFNPNSETLGDTVAKRNQRLAKLLTDIGNFHLEDAAADFDELLRYYVTNAGKKGGDHFTPPTIAQLVARLAIAANPKARTIYDPAFGSGSLLIEGRRRLGRDSTRVFGQELVLTNYHMARMNLLLHDIGYDSFDLAGGISTLTAPAHEADQPFEIIVSNPKWSTPWEGKDNPLLINDERFAPAGVLAPKQYHDLAFTMHAVSWLSSNGVAVLVQFPGTLYRGNAEATIRRYLVDSNLVDAVIQLPPDWGYGVTVPGCIIVLRRAKSDNAVLFIDASREFKRVGNKNEMQEVHQKTVVDAFLAREDVDYFSRLVSAEEIEAREFDLSVSRYVQSPRDREPVDIFLLNGRIADIVKHQIELRNEIDAIVADLEGVEA